MRFWYKRKKGSAIDKGYFAKPGLVTTLYPHESIPVPDNGRYRLHNEINDCIVCDLCAKVCPVNCITIDPIKSPVEIGKTSDGSTKRIYAATFDIDMAKCCYCGLCTTVCPTECLTMTPSYDFSEFDLKNMTYAFADLKAEEAELRKQEWEKHQAAKTAEKKSVEAKASETDAKGNKETPAVKPVIPAFKPIIKMPPKANPDNSTADTE